MINDYEKSKDEIRRSLEDQYQNEERTIKALKRQQEVRLNLQQFLNIELGLETIFQTAG